MKLCGDCIVLSGTNGFIGAGRIPHLPDSGTGAPSESRRIYVRRLLNSFHGDDAVVRILATPRPVDGNADNHDIAKSVLASADDLGSVCIWHRDHSAPGSSYNPSNSATSARTGYSWTLIHHAKVGHKVTALSFAPDGHTLAVCSAERAILFDIGTVLNLATAPTIDPTDTKMTPRYAIRTVVIDDTVGLTTTETVFAVDLSNLGTLKVWKVAEGFDVMGNVSAADETTGGRPTSVDRSVGNFADRVTFVEMSLEQVLRRFDSSISLGELFSRSTCCESLESAVVVDRCIASDDDNSDGNESEHSAPPVSIVPKEKDVRETKEVKDTGDSGFYVDPFGYADVFVIDPLRMHLRDWWCDYSSRYLLLGHGRVSALTNFESSALSTYVDHVSCI